MANKSALQFFADVIKGEPGEEGNRGQPGKQGAEGEVGQYIPELDEIIAGNIGIQGELGQYEKMCCLFLIKIFWDYFWIVCPYMYNISEFIIVPCLHTANVLNIFLII